MVFIIAGFAFVSCFFFLFLFVLHNCHTNHKETPNQILNLTIDISIYIKKSLNCVTPIQYFKLIFSAPFSSLCKLYLGRESGPKRVRRTSDCSCSTCFLNTSKLSLSSSRCPDFSDCYSFTFNIKKIIKKNIKICCPTLII